MTVFRNMFYLAFAAGLVVGVVMTILQHSFTVPLILAAEAYENAGAAAEPAHDHAAPAAGTAVAAHAHDAEAWAPSDGFQRTFFSVAANIVTGVGFSLLLIAVSEFAGGIVGWRSGLLWGLAGFAVFTVAPDLGLPPELPAMPAADLLARQVWWVGTVIAAAVALALIFLGRSPAMAAVGILLLVVPHLVGAPQPESFETPIPEGLHHQFVVAVTLTNLVFWAVLGSSIGVLRPRVAAWLDAPKGRLA